MARLSFHPTYRFWTIASVILVACIIVVVAINAVLTALNNPVGFISLASPLGVAGFVNLFEPAFLPALALVVTLTMRSTAKHNQQHAWTKAHEDNVSQAVMPENGGVPTAALQLQLDSDSFVPLFQTPIGSTVAVTIPSGTLTSTQTGTKIICHLTDDYGQLVPCRLVGSQTLGEQTLQLELERLS